MSVDPGFEAPGWVPHEPHTQQSLLDQVDPLLTKDRLVRNLLPASLTTCVPPHDTRLSNSSGVLHVGSGGDGEKAPHLDETGGRHVFRLITISSLPPWSFTQSRTSSQYLICRTASASAGVPVTRCHCSCRSAQVRLT